MGVPIDAENDAFRQFVRDEADDHQPDLIGFDNLAHIVSGDYSDSKRVHAFGGFVYGLARDANAAIITAAHPRKNSAEHPVKLTDENDGTPFFEAIMGSSQFINSMGSLWGLERIEDRTVFLGGRQRVDGHQQRTYLELDDDGRFYPVSSVEINQKLVLNTSTRREAWTQLPSIFRFSEGLGAVRNVMHARDSFNKWIQECVRLGVLVKAPDGRYRKSSGTAPA